MVFSSCATLNPLSKSSLYTKNVRKLKTGRHLPKWLVFTVRNLWSIKSNGDHKINTLLFQLEFFSLITAIVHVLLLNYFKDVFLHLGVHIINSAIMC